MKKGSTLGPYGDTDRFIVLLLLLIQIIIINKLKLPLKSINSIHHLYYKYKSNAPTPNFYHLLEHPLTPLPLLLLPHPQLTTLPCRHLLHHPLLLLPFYYLLLNLLQNILLLA